MEERTGWRGQNESQTVGEEKRNGRLVGRWCCRDQQRVCKMAQALAEILEHAGHAEKKRMASMPQKEQLASMPDPSLPKGKGTESSVQSTRS